MKRQANTLSAIIKNFDTVEAAIESSTNAMGSAETENAKWLDSIEGRITLFKNEVQNMWVGALDSDFIKNLVNIGTELVKLVEKVGLLKTALIGLSTYMTFSKKFPNMIGSAGEQFTLFNYTIDQIKERYETLSARSSRGKLSSGWGALFGGEIKIDPSKILKEDEFDSVISNITEGFNNLQVSYNEDTFGDYWAGYVDTLTGVDESMKNVLKTSEAQNEVLQTGTVSFQTYSAGMQQIGAVTSQTTAKMVAMKAASMALNMVLGSLIGIGISIAIGAIYNGINNLIHAEENAAKAAQEAVANYKQTTGELENQKKTVDELASAYLKLAPGVNTETNTNIGLTTESYQEYLDICNQIAEIYPELVLGYDAQGNAILSLQGKVDGLTESYNNANEAAANQFLTAENKKNIWDTYSNTNKVITEGMTANGDYVGVTLADQKKVLESVKNMSYDNFSKLFEYDKSGMADMWDILREQLIKDGAYTNDAEMMAAFNSMTFDLSGLDEYKKSLTTKLTEIQQSAAQAVSGIKEVITSNLVFNEDYQKLDTGLQGIVNSIIGDIDLDMVEKSGAKNADEFYTWFKENVVDKITDGAYQDLYSGITDMSDEMVKAMADGDSDAFKKAKGQFDNLISGWVNEESGNIEIDPEADAVTQYLQKLAQQIQEQSKNFEVKLQFKEDYESSAENLNKQNEALKKRQQEAQDLIDSYNKNKTEAESYGIDLSQVKFGNIDLDNRQILEWSEENKKKFEDAIRSWDINFDDLGGYSTELGTSMNFDGLEIAFSPMLQTDKGAQLLTKDTVEQYLSSLINELESSKDSWTSEDLFALDAQGLDIEGQHIQGLIADVGESARTTAETMHYLGNTGAIADGWDKIGKAAAKAGLSAEEYVEAVQNGDWSKIGLELPEESVTVSELLDDQTAEDYIKNAQKMSKSSGALAQAYTAMINSMAGDNEQFDSSDFVDMYDKWIETGKKVPEGADWTDEQIAGLNMLDVLIKNYNGDVDTLKQSLIDIGLLTPSIEDIGTFDLSSDSTNDVIDQFQSDIDTIKEAWESLNSKEMTKSEFIDLAQQFPELMDGVNLSNDNWMVKAKENLEELNKVKIQDFIDKLEQMKAAMEANGEDTSVVNSFLNYAYQLQNAPISEPEQDKTVPDTISGITEAYENYKTILAETNEILYDGQKVSEDYYSSLKEYIDDVDELDSCFDSTNKSIVTNVNKLKKLIAQQKNQTKSTVSMAKAQSMLQYKKLLSELANITNGTNTLTTAQIQQANSLNEQISSVRAAIDDYKLLELELSNATEAFIKYQEAKDKESSTDYEPTMLEMIESVMNGFDTGEVGSESFLAAAKGLLNESITGNLDTAEELDAVWEAMTSGSMSKFFTYTDDQFEITEGNLENFVDACQKAGLMTGTTFDEFEINSTKSLKDFADSLGLSEDAVLAFLDILSDYTIGGEKLWGDLVDFAWSKDIDDANAKLDELLQKRAELQQSGQYNGELEADIIAAQNEVSAKYDEVYAKVEKYTAAVNMANAINPNSGISFSTEELEYIQQKYNEIFGTEYNLEIKDGKLVAVSNELDEVNAKKSTLATPVEGEIKLDYQHALDNIESIKQKIEEVNGMSDKEVTLQYGTNKSDLIATLNNDLSEAEQQANMLEVTYGFTPSSAEDQTIIDKFEDLEANGVNTTINADTTQANQDVDTFKQNAEEPVTTTLTVNVEQGTTNVESTGDSGVTVNFKETGYQDVVNKISYLTAQAKVPIDQDVDVDDNDTIENVSGELTELENQTVNDKDFDVSDNYSINVVSNKISSLQTQLDNLPTSKTITINVQQNGSIPSGGTSVNGTAHSYGTSHVVGTANSSGNWALQHDENGSLVGELGQEIVCRDGRYFTVGDRGAEFVDLKKGDIIFNHIQARSLLEHGYVNSRGKMLAGGTAHAAGTAHLEGPAHANTYMKHFNWSGNQNTSDSFNGVSNAADSLSDTADSLSDTAEDIEDETEQVIDFIEYKLENIENIITKTTSKLETFLDDTSQISQKNDAYDAIIEAEKSKAETYFKAIDVYEKRAAELLAEIPDEFKGLAQNGGLIISDFIGEEEGKIVTAIEEYREWAQKATDAEASYYDTIIEIASKSVEKQQAVAKDYENVIGLKDRHSDLIQGQMDLLEEKGERLSENFYKNLINTTNDKIGALEEERAALQKVLDDAVTSGNVEKGDDDWYEMVNAIYDVDDAIIECNIDLEEFQNAINDLYWDNLNKLIDRLDGVQNEIESLYDIVSDDDKVVDEFGNWTSEGIAALGLLAQQMETAKFKVQQYGEAISQLEKDYKNGLYSADEYNEKLAELKEAQWDEIKTQEQAKKSIIELNKVRIEAVKDGIQKEIDAYSELIDKKKTELQLSKDAHDFATQVAEKQKDIADIQKKLAAMAGDNSASANAEKKKLQEELYNAQAELEELYYEHSIEKQQDALDDSLENFQNEKEDEMDALDEYLKDEERVISDSYETIKANTEQVVGVLTDIANEYGISLSDAVINPWKEGVNAIGTYEDALNTASSVFTDYLEGIKQGLLDLQRVADETATKIINATSQKEQQTTSAEYEEPKAPETPATPAEPEKPSTPTVGQSVTVKKTATNFTRDGGNGTRMQSWVPGYTFTVMQIDGSEVLIGLNGQVTGWVDKKDLEGFAKGSKRINKDQLAIVDELGDELQLIPNNQGRLSYIKKGTGIIPADLTERLMKWGQLDPSSFLKDSVPSMNVPNVTTNEFNINMSFGELLHVDSVSQDTLPNLQKLVRSEFDNCIKSLNNSLKRFAR